MRVSVKEIEAVVGSARAVCEYAFTTTEKDLLHYLVREDLIDGLKDAIKRFDESQGKTS